MLRKELIILKIMVLSRFRQAMLIGLKTSQSLFVYKSSIAFVPQWWKSRDETENINYQTFQKKQLTDLS